ncbi:SCO2525 family SAM-dependent methyltransferase [Streptomyces massasporeus]|uniref:SCO2525 family SAM-dependent methyltransferase n=1 Tax=Streptomyces massasporeus TaxID=67324 RepID=UPI0038224102
MTSRPSVNRPSRNADAPWGLFNPAAYVDQNYRYLHEDDAAMLCIVRDHFADHFRNHDGGLVSGLDAGAGANLYPALAMLPWCDEITLLERAPSNVEYLAGQLPSYGTHWDPFWDALCEREAYRSLVPDPRDRVRGAVRVQQGDIFDLSRHEGRWSVGTMFFVAESMSELRQEFDTGVKRFMRALAPGAPFAAAFMAESCGYIVGGQHFPACAVDERDVHASLESCTADFKVVRPSPRAGVRTGYEGVILAYGWRR